MDGPPLRAGPMPGGQFFRFAAVGAVGFAIDAGVLQAMISLAGTGPYGGRAVSFALAVTATWLLNRRWVFGGGKRTRRAEYARYFGVQTAGTLINLSIYAALIETVAVMAAYPVLALCGGAAVALIFNFLASRAFVFDAGENSDGSDRFVTGGDGPDFGGSENLEVMAEAKNYNRFLLNLVDRAAGATQQILDFGAGRGTFAAPLAARGRHVTCVEPDERLHRYFDASGLEVHGALTAVAPDSVEFAYTLNVLEHIEDDGAALSEIRARLKPGGRLLVYVPAFDLLYSSMDRKVGHVRRYRRRQLARTVKRAGLNVERARYVDSIGFLAALAYRVMGNDSGDINRTALRIYDRFVFPVSRAVDIVASRFFGKNVLVVARRP